MNKLILVLYVILTALMFTVAECLMQTAWEKSVANNRQVLAELPGMVIYYQPRLNNGKPWAEFEEGWEELYK